MYLDSKYQGSGYLGPRLAYLESGWFLLQYSSNSLRPLFSFLDFCCTVLILSLSVKFLEEGRAGREESLKVALKVA